MSEKDKEHRVCMRCKHVNDKIQYCIKCGAPLVNRCVDEPGLLEKGCGKANPSEAAYCQFCGQPTLFNKFGIVQPYLED
jgi:hypothetical protein